MPLIFQVQYSSKKKRQNLRAYGHTRPQEDQAWAQGRKRTKRGHKAVRGPSVAQGRKRTKHMGTRPQEDEAYGYKAADQAYKAARGPSERWTQGRKRTKRKMDTRPQEDL